MNYAIYLILPSIQGPDAGAEHNATSAPAGSGVVALVPGSWNNTGGRGTRETQRSMRRRVKFSLRPATGQPRITQITPFQ